MGPPVERSRALYWWALSAVLVAAGIFGVVYALSRPSVGPNINKPIGVTSLQSWQVPGTASSQALSFSASISNATTESNALTVARTKPSSSGTSLASLAHVTPLKGRSRPVHIQIPSIGVSASVSVLGLNRDGSVQVPTNFQVPGWYKYGPAPGQKGSAVILGHVDSYKGPAIFFLVKDLKIGSRVNVTLANHTIVRFAVIGVREYSKGHFPSRLVYGTRSYSALQLVTCGGVFDHATGHYESNIVAFTALVGKTVPRRI
jgi:Sortase domain